MLIQLTPDPWLCSSVDYDAQDYNCGLEYNIFFSISRLYRMWERGRNKFIRVNILGILTMIYWCTRMPKKMLLSYSFFFDVWFSCSAWVYNFTCPNGLQDRMSVMPDLLLSTMQAAGLNTIHWQYMIPIQHTCTGEVFKLTLPKMYAD